MTLTPQASGGSSDEAAHDFASGTSSDWVSRTMLVSWGKVDGLSKALSALEQTRISLLGIARAQRYHVQPNAGKQWQSTSN
ncbi:hypothetical protein ColTof4_05461 [Colletotrichum tofieldiae]|nr:hypothetical protein ColTof3_10284 [Colletotrichum tofieldiae]GKT73038.1 hypothetical protein ColTof4_05461 [Colletotrichum tofieldiae]GKT89111.1 hypothetical protein Ct61P_06961 [Colletotrichum tofieldiae]